MREYIREQAEVKRRLGRVIRRIRIESGITQGELSRRIGVTRTFVNLIEHGQRVPSYGTLVRIASCLDRRATDLIAEAQLSDVDDDFELIDLLSKAVKEPEKLRQIATYIRSLKKD